MSHTWQHPGALPVSGVTADQMREVDRVMTEELGIARDLLRSPVWINCGENLIRADVEISKLFSHVAAVEEDFEQRINSLTDITADLVSEIVDMKPVVEAAVEWRTKAAFLGVSEN